MAMPAMRAPNPATAAPTCSARGPRRSRASASRGTGPPPRAPARSGRPGCRARAHSSRHGRAQRASLTAMSGQVTGWPRCTATPQVPSASSPIAAPVTPWAQAGGRSGGVGGLEHRASGVGQQDAGARARLQARDRGRHRDQALVQRSPAGDQLQQPASLDGRAHRPLALGDVGPDAPKWPSGRGNFWLRNV